MARSYLIYQQMMSSIASSYDHFWPLTLLPSLGEWRHLASCKQLVRCPLDFLDLARESLWRMVKFHRSCLGARCKWIDISWIIMICQSFGKVDENLRVTDELHHFHNQHVASRGAPSWLPEVVFIRKMWILTYPLNRFITCHKVMLKLSEPWPFLGDLVFRATAGIHCAKPPR